MLFPIPPWQPHLDRLRGFTIADPRPRLVAYAKEHGAASLYNGHYSPVGYRLVAEALAEALAPLARIENRDLWERLLALTRRHDVDFIKVKGHSNNKWNNRCDELAVAAAATYR